MPDRTSISVLEWLAAGGLGSFIAAAFSRDQGPWEMGLSVLCGTACAYYLGPYVSEVAGLAGNGQSALGFVTGLTGMFVVRGLMNAAREFQRDPWAVWNRLRGRGGPSS